MTDHITNRHKLLTRVREELVGPVRDGKELDCSKALVFENNQAALGPWIQAGILEEILTGDTPTVRYGVGVLYPLDIELIEEQDAPKEEGGSGLQFDQPAVLTEEAVKDIEEIVKRTEYIGGEHDDDDFDLSAANARRPSSMAVSFLLDTSLVRRLRVDFSGGRYHPHEVTIAGKLRKWWLREPVALTAFFDCAQLKKEANRLVLPVQQDASGLTGLALQAEVYSRPFEESETLRLITVCVINRSAGGKRDEHCVFQSGFSVCAEGEQRQCILPYPDKRTVQGDEEEEQLALLYRGAETFAVGHGCSANWSESITSRVSTVFAECLPTYEVPSITPDITREDDTPLTVSMRALANLDKGLGYSELEELVVRYEKWISDRRKEAQALPKHFQAAATRNIAQCQTCAERMREGISFLRGNKTARSAFQLANEAILLQQLQSKRPLRRYKYDAKAKRPNFSQPYSEPDLAHVPSGRGNWRAFQIAFLLMNLKPIAKPSDTERETVELIWFPTGGGKTEAYLGLTAYATFLRRLTNKEDVGVNVLMRYTLRLLTAQQFQRAASLLCAMEVIRKRRSGELGDTSFSIGIWLGGSTTPNTRKDAVAALKQLMKDPKDENPFVLARCPWCGAEMGVLKDKPSDKNAPKVVGYELSSKTVVFKCPDHNCLFTRGLPVYVVDEDIYEVRPSLIIGTVDKFAMLAWRPEARALFGLDEEGNRVASPPGLIIQDELHLISGPLGSIVGLYETLIEYLCTDHRHDKPIAPKIVCSTATIRRYKEQIKALYAREGSALFPPPGLSSSDSFFARYAKKKDGSLCNGRLFVGVNAPGHGSIQTTQVRTFTAMLQGTVPMSNEERDPWWTLLIFFNSLRELGTTLSLFQSDIPSYLYVMKQRYGLGYKDVRSLHRILELTGRVRSDKIPEAISELEVRTTEAEVRPVDVCLASNIIEVGVDIDRLSVMSVFGQPKTTSQYIQVTGRVGRQWAERPGLIVTLYSPSKPRDRSHFEKFRSYHERLYAQVEPTSVTPFSPPAVDRALHAVLVGYARQVGDTYLAKSPYPFPAELLDQFRHVIEERVEVVDVAEHGNTLKVLDKRLRQWDDWKRTTWQGSWKDDDIPMLRESGSYVTSVAAKLSWPTPMSMRNVDAECQSRITRLYIPDEDGDRT